MRSRSSWMTSTTALLSPLRINQPAERFQKLNHIPPGVRHPGGFFCWIGDSPIWALSVAEGDGYDFFCAGARISFGTDFVWHIIQAWFLLCGCTSICWFLPILDVTCGPPESDYVHCGLFADYGRMPADNLLRSVRPHSFSIVIWTYIVPNRD